MTESLGPDINTQVFGAKVERHTNERGGNFVLIPG